MTDSERLVEVGGVFDLRGLAVGGALLLAAALFWQGGGSPIASAQEALTANVAPAPPPGGLTQVVAGTADVQALIDAQSFVVESVWKLDVATQQFQVHIPGAPAFANTLTSLAPTDIVTLKAAPTPVPAAQSTLIMNGRVLIDGAPVVAAELEGGYYVTLGGGGRFEELVTVTTGVNGEYRFELPWATVEEFVLPGGPIMVRYVGSDTLPCYFTGGAGAPAWLIVESPGTYTLDVDLVELSAEPCTPHG